jgi:hypothetical protein
MTRRSGLTEVSVAPLGSWVYISAIYPARCAGLISCRPSGTVMWHFGDRGPAFWWKKQVLRLRLLMSKEDGCAPPLWGSGSSFKLLTQDFVLGYTLAVPAGTVCGAAGRCGIQEILFISSAARGTRVGLVRMTSCWIGRRPVRVWRPARQPVRRPALRLRANDYALTITR